MFFETICILLSISEIILFARHRLEPGTYLVLQVVKSTIWTVVFIIYVVRLATLKDGLGATNPLAFFLGGDLEAIILLCVPFSLLLLLLLLPLPRQRSQSRNPYHPN